MLEKLQAALRDQGLVVLEDELSDALHQAGLTVVPEGDPWGLAAEAGDIVGFALTRNNGVRLAAFFDLVAGVMRGNPERLKVGYPAAGALSLICSVLSLTNDEKAELRAALDYCCNRDLNPDPVPAGL